MARNKPPGALRWWRWPACPDDEAYVVASFFATEADARKVAAEVPGIFWGGKVKTYCLD